MNPDLNARIALPRLKIGLHYQGHESSIGLSTAVCCCELKQFSVRGSNCWLFSSAFLFLYSWRLHDSVAWMDIYREGLKINFSLNWSPRTDQAFVQDPSSPVFDKG